MRTVEMQINNCAKIEIYLGKNRFFAFNLVCLMTVTMKIFLAFLRDVFVGYNFHVFRFKNFASEINFLAFVIHFNTKTFGHKTSVTDGKQCVLVCVCVCVCCVCDECVVAYAMLYAVCFDVCFECVF